jgi:5-methylcytosine-specific restriction enzyme A
MSELDRLRPTAHRRVIDLVREAGVDVTHWGDYADGTRSPAANPRYCYEWAFIEPGQVVVLNLWHSGMREIGGVIQLQDNLRRQAERYARLRGKATWRKRAEKLDQAVRTAAHERLPIRAIVLDGRVRAHADAESAASQVKARRLDPVPWAVTSYDEGTGDFTVSRGALQERLIDQFSPSVTVDGPTEVRDRSGMVFVRSAVVRQVALRRANGRCEWCGEYGFATDDGAVFLETHHVLPLSEGGRDRADNVVALCANHHREAHFGAARASIRAKLIAIFTCNQSTDRSGVAAGSD